MLVLSKIIYFFISPFAWLLIALFLWAFLKNKKWKRIARMATFVIALFFSNSVILNESYRAWEVHSVDKNELAHYDVGIVLGGMFQNDADVNRLSVRRGADRIWQAMDLYYSKKIDKIALIGKNGEVLVNWMDEATLLKDKLVEFGIPEEDIIVENESMNTHQNAMFTAELFKTTYPQYKDFLLITSAFHIKRAKACFDKQGLETTAYPVGQISSIKRHYKWHHFIIPNGATFWGWFDLLKEIVGYCSYKVLGYV